MQAITLLAPLAATSGGSWRTQPWWSPPPA